MGSCSCWQQLFCHDIGTLLSLDNLWAKRQRPRALDLSELEDIQDLDVRRAPLAFYTLACYLTSYFAL